jgi:uncharacterized membrane-anchored protein
MKSRTAFAVSLAVLTLLLVLGLPAQNQASAPEQKSPIDWQKGPTKGDLGGMAEIEIPEGYLFTDKKGAQKLLELTHNFPSGTEVGAIVPASNEEDWFVIFEFSDVGYVKDDEKDKIDATGLLKSLTEGTENQNETRKEKGWPAFHILGWEKSPYYDPQTHNLNWAIRGKSDSGSQAVNHSVRLLGRRGTMNVDIVLAPEDYARVMPEFEGVMGNFKFNEGHRYSDFVAGDKVAAYGLTALIAGGAGAAAVKTGLLAKFWKALVAIILALKKLIIVIVAGIGAAIKKFWNWITGRKQEENQYVAPDPPAAPAPENEKALASTSKDE